MNNKVIFNPIFVIGQGRSGTSAITNGIGMHPEVSGHYTESPLVHEIGNVMYNYYYGKLANYYQNHNASGENQVMKKLAETTYLYSVDRKLPLKKRAKDFLKSLLKDKEFFWKKKYYVTKAVRTNEHSFYGLKKLYPEAKYIYI